MRPAAAAHLRIPHLQDQQRSQRQRDVLQPLVFEQPAAAAQQQPQLGPRRQQLHPVPA
jgi:hypothetical protein